MAWTPSAVAAVVFGGAAVAVAVGVAALRRRPDPLAAPLAALMFGVAAWAVPHAVSTGFADVGAVAFWQRVRYPGTVLAPVAYLVVAVRYAGYERWLSGRTYAALAAVPVLTVALVWTNPLHGLFWESLALARVGNASVLMPAFGPWYWVNLAYLYLLTAAGLVLFADVALRAGTLYRKQATLMFLGGVVPLATNVALRAGATPSPALDLTAPSLSVTGVTFALALFYLDTLEVRPVARDRLVEELDDGVVVVGPEGRIRDFNPTAERVLGDIAVKQPAGEVLPENVAGDGGELVTETDEGRRLFRSRTTGLYDDRGRDAGRIVYLNDVTEVVEREQRISVLNRILRHNIRNRLNVARGHVTALEDATREDREHVEKAAESIDRVVELAERARSVERTLHERGDGRPVEVTATVDRAVADVRSRFADAEIETRGTAEPVRARVADGALLESALIELVENAVVHNDSDPAWASVRVERGDGRVRVAVADDGPGVPEHERQVLTARAESRLEHGSGLGLWLAKWTASLSGGELSFAGRDPRGSVVTLSLPAATE